jgi:hypothetical protein
MKYQNRNKIAIFRRLFHGLKNVYGSYDIQTGRSYQVKEPVTDAVILNHLIGNKPYGVYLLMKDKIGAIASDFDTEDRMMPSEFIFSAKHYGLDAYIERSKSKGYHVWIFFENGDVLASKARVVVHHILEEIKCPETEVFPKQDRLDGIARFGNFINTPLYGALVPKGKTVFINPYTFRPYKDQWKFLDSISQHNESILDEIIALNNIAIKPYVKLPPKERKRKNSNSFYGLPICAQKIFQNGVTQLQRDSAFRLAVHMKRLGFPFDISVATLLAWSQKNKPAHSKRVITKKEIIKQSENVYYKNYRGFGCQSEAIRPFCDSNCPVKKILR